MQTRSASKTTGNKSKIFNFPIVDELERKIRKLKKNMGKLSKSATLTSTVRDDNDETSGIYEKILTTKISFPLSSDEPPESNDLPPESERAATPPPLPPKQTKFAPPKPPRATTPQPAQENKNTTDRNGFESLTRHACRVIKWIVYFFLLLALIGGILVLYENYKTWGQNDADENRFHTIILDQKTMTFKFSD